MLSCRWLLDFHDRQEGESKPRATVISRSDSALTFLARLICRSGQVVCFSGDLFLLAGDGLLALWLCRALRCGVLIGSVQGQANAPTNNKNEPPAKENIV